MPPHCHCAEQDQRKTHQCGIGPIKPEGRSRQNGYLESPLVHQPCQPFGKEGHRAADDLKQRQGFEILGRQTQQLSLIHISIPGTGISYVSEESIRSAETPRSSTQPPAFETEVVQSTDRSSYKDADFAALMTQIHLVHFLNKAFFIICLLYSSRCV